MAGFCLSATGYDFLGHRTEGFSDEFQRGLKQARQRLGDPDLSTWDRKFRRDVHALVFFAHDYVSQLVKELIKLRERMEGQASVSSEFGVTMRNPEDDPIEHFGYVDGREPADILRCRPSQEAAETLESGGRSDLVLLRDPHATSDAECGTYVVFRKLEQNVKGFKEEERSVAEKLEWHGEEEELVGAMIVDASKTAHPSSRRRTSTTRARRTTLSSPRIQTEIDVRSSHTFGRQTLAETMPSERAALRAECVLGPNAAWRG